MSPHHHRRTPIACGTLRIGRNWASNGKEITVARNNNNNKSEESQKLFNIIFFAADYSGAKHVHCGGAWDGVCCLRSEHGMRQEKYLQIDEYMITQAVAPPPSSSQSIFSMEWNRYHWMCHFDRESQSEMKWNDFFSRVSVMIVSSHRQS